MMANRAMIATSEMSTDLLDKSGEDDDEKEGKRNYPSGNQNERRVIL